MNDPRAIDRRHAQLAILREAEKQYEANAASASRIGKRRLLARYTRKPGAGGRRAGGPAFRPDRGGAWRGRRQLRWEVWEARRALSAAEDGPPTR